MYNLKKRLMFKDTVGIRTIDCQQKLTQRLFIQNVRHGWFSVLFLFFTFLSLLKIHLLERQTKLQGCELN